MIFRLFSISSTGIFIIPYFLAALIHAATIIDLTIESKYTSSKRQLISPYIVLATPVATPADRPTGPFKLSIYPGSGSSKAGITKRILCNAVAKCKIPASYLPMAGRNITALIDPKHKSSTTFSASFLV